jgi:hypothetical protein
LLNRIQRTQKIIKKKNANEKKLRFFEWKVKGPGYKKGLK